MKKPKDHLYRLVISMTPPEKRYFKIHFGQIESVLTKLFDIVNHLTEYDEEFVKTQLHPTAAKNLKVHKIQLAELLLKSLTLFHSQKSVYSKIRMGLEEVDLLIDKELYEMATDRLSKLKKLCLEYQEYAYLIEVINRDFRLNHIRYDKIGQSQLPIFEELKSAIEHLHEQFRFAELGNRVLDIKRKQELSGFSEEEIEYSRRLLASDFLQKENEPRSFRARLSRNTLLTFLHDIHDNREKSLYYRLNSVTLFREHPDYARHHSFDFLGTLRNLVNLYLKENLYEETRLVIKEAIDFGEKYKIHREQLVYFHYSELVIEYNLGNFESITKNIEPKIIKHLEHYDISEDRIGIITFLYLAITHLVLENHIQTQDFLRQLLKAPNDLQDYFIEVFTLVELISHYESNEHILLHNILNTKNRQLKKRGGNSIFYKEILKFFKKLIDQPYHSAELAQAFLAKLEKMNSEKVLGMFFYFKLNLWLKAVAQRYTLSEAFALEQKA
ncbi:MAG: hypothetical protein SFU99_22255 [Saprospiraceae bacterium]|nr:hypothetical protein [Saprospiraceae bacterium]